MGKQSARLYYHGKDHKDIYFQGKYHNAMIVRKEGDPELVWRKLYDEGYFVYTRWEIYITSYQYYTAILYPYYRIREYRNEISQQTYHSDKYLARKNSYSSVGAVVSADGKLWKRISGNSKEYGVFPKGDGIVKVVSQGSGKYEYTYIPYKNEEIDEENALLIYSDADSGTRTQNSIFGTNGITDAILLLDQSHSPYKVFAVDMTGNVYNELFTTVYSEIGGCGCYNGMYYCAFTNIPDGGYVYVSNSIGGTWERREVPLKAREVYTIQSDDGIVVYLNRINDITYGAVHIYTTTDFINYTKVDIQTRLTVPIISQIYPGEKEYINFMLAYGSQEIDNAYNFKVYSFAYSYLIDMAKNTICYIENCKISPPKGMIIQFDVTVGTRKRQVTVYLDNLFFQPSEGNFAFFEELYPEEFMNDYLDKEGD